MGPRLPILATLSLALAAATPADRVGEAGGRDDFERDVRDFVLAHCARCHGSERAEAELVLTGVDSPEHARADADTWDWAAERVRLGEMPPKGEPRPAEAAARAFVERLEDVLDLAPADALDPGRPVLRRLSAREYANTVRDVLGVEVDAGSLLPADAIGHGFTTVGAAQSLSDEALERYLAAAREVAARAVVVEPDEPPVRRYGADELGGDGAARGGFRVLATVGTAGAAHGFPRAGLYRVRVRAGAQQAGPETARMRVLAGDERLGEVEVAAVQDAPEVYALEARIEGGTRRVGARFVNDYYRPEDPDPSKRDRNLWVSWIEVEGPLDPPPRTAFQTGLFGRFGSELGGERESAILAYLVLRLWRRPAERSELRRLELLVAEQPTLEARVRLALEALLASPHFLFHVEDDPPGASAGVRDLDGFELATRLASFLWSSAPDEALLDAAARGELATREGRDAELSRLLADPRARALADGFAAQWLQLASLDAVAIDPDRFPGYDDELRAAMRAETLDVFDAVLREGRSAWELLDADWTIVGPRLASHYGLAEAAGDAEGDRGAAHVSLAGTARRGVLGHASVLTLTSDPTRTSPVKRGKWVLEVLLGAPPPPPPPGVGVLEETEAPAGASMRERLELHRADPGCAVCHARMDPLGFGLESFDATGAWRETEGGRAIDASGELPDGSRFDGPLELVALLRSDEGFVRHLARELLVYALGRGLERADRRVVEEILAELDPAAPTLEGIVRGIAHSIPFTRRREK